MRISDCSSDGCASDRLEVSDVMMHRTAMRAVNADDAPEAVVRAILESPYTRMPLWRNSAENIVGIVHAKDLLRALAEPEAAADTIDMVQQIGRAQCREEGCQVVEVSEVSETLK